MQNRNWGGVGGYEIIQLNNGFERAFCQVYGSL